MVMTFNKQVRKLQRSNWEIMRDLWYSKAATEKERRQDMLRCLMSQDRPVNGKYYLQVKDSKELQWLIKKGLVKIVKRQHTGIMAQRGTHQQWAVLVRKANG